MGQQMQPQRLSKHPAWMSLTPFHNHSANHPVFRYETRWLRHAASNSAFVNYTTRWLGYGVLFALITVGMLTLVFLLPTHLGADPSTAVISLCIVLLAASGLAGILLDFTSVNGGLRSINSDVVSGRWDLLRVTPLREGGLILAKHAAAQLRVWRGVTIMIGLRVGLIGIWAIMIGIELTRLPTQTFSAPRSWTTLLALPPILLAAVVEPIMRVRGFAALGLYISARTINRQRGGGGDILLALGILSILWLIQAILLLALVLFIGPLAVAYTLGDRSGTVVWAIFVPVAAAAYCGLSLTIRDWALRGTAQRLLRTADKAR